MQTPCLRLEFEAIDLGIRSLRIIELAKVYLNQATASLKGKDITPKKELRQA